MVVGDVSMSYNNVLTDSQSGSPGGKTLVSIQFKRKDPKSDFLYYGNSVY
jgi:hypothetical protein